jgi:hypothetical protein
MCLTKEERFEIASKKLLRLSWRKQENGIHAVTMFAMESNHLAQWNTVYNTYLFQADSEESSNKFLEEIQRCFQSMRECTQPEW